MVEQITYDEFIRLYSDPIWGNSFWMRNRVWDEQHWSNYPVVDERAFPESIGMGRYYDEAISVNSALGEALLAGVWFHGMIDPVRKELPNNYSRYHNGMLVKRSSFLGVYQLSAQVPVFLTPPEHHQGYSHLVYFREMTRYIRDSVSVYDTLLGKMSDQEWNKALDDGDIVISPSGMFVTLNYKAQGGRLNNRQKRRCG